MSEYSRKPEIIVFAGPNGSGKSTFTELLKPFYFDPNEDWYAEDIQALTGVCNMEYKKLN